MPESTCGQRLTNTILTDEIDELCETYRATPINFVQLTPGRLGAEIHDISTPRIELREAAFEAGVFLSKSSPFPRFAAGFCVAGSSKLFGSNLTDSNVGYLNGRNGVYAHIQAGSRWCNISIDHGLVQQVAEVHNYTIPDGDYSSGLPATVHAAITRILCHTARGECFTELSTAQLEDELTRSLLRVLNPQQAHRKMRIPPQWRKTQRAIEYIHEHFADSMTVTGLCHLADVSERTLQYAFLEITGFSMQQYLMRYRLLRARALLTAGNVNLAREAAVAVGIPHTGRFSLYFRKMYGESPSMLLTPPSKSSTVSVS